MFSCGLSSRCLLVEVQILHSPEVPIEDPNPVSELPTRESTILVKLTRLLISTRNNTITLGLSRDWRGTRTVPAWPRTVALSAWSRRTRAPTPPANAGQILVSIAVSVGTVLLCPSTHGGAEW